MVLDEVSSSWSDVSFGVPQGSISGPLFFVIFISDLPEVVLPGKTITFMQSTVNVLESSTLLVILSQQELNYLHQCILALPYSESVEGWVLSTAFYFLHRLLLL